MRVPNYGLGIIVAIVSATVGLVLLSEEVPAESPASPIFGVKIPAGYREWQMVSPALVGEPLNEIRVVLGNRLAIDAYKSEAVPFPDGVIFAKLSWQFVPSPEFAEALVPGPATTIQIMVKDSKRYADTGGWGFGRFVDGVPVDEAQHKTCFACHEAFVKNHDFVFTRWAR